VQHDIVCVVILDQHLSQLILRIRIRRIHYRDLLKKLLCALAPAVATTSTRDCISQSVRMIVKIFLLGEFLLYERV
jgi:hypothetical protein